MQALQQRAALRRLMCCVAQLQAYLRGGLASEALAGGPTAATARWSHAARQVAVEDAEALISFFNECCDNRSVASTRMNDRSSRSHAIYTVVLHRTLVEVSEDGGKARRGA